MPYLQGVVTTLAGSGKKGWSDATGALAEFDTPMGLGVDKTGEIFVADSNNHRIRHITPAGVVTTFVGNGVVGLVDGVGTAASVTTPRGVAFDSSGTNFYLADWGNTAIRFITSGAKVTTFAGSQQAGLTDANGAKAAFNQPLGVAVDSTGNVYVTDYYNCCVRKITPSADVTTFAGSGYCGYVDATGSAAKFQNPSAIALSGTDLYVGEGLHIRKITSAAVVTTFVKIGAQAITVDKTGMLYVSSNNIINRIAPNGDIVPIAGSLGAGSADGTGTAASFNGPVAITGDGAGNFYIADAFSNKIRKMTVIGAGELVVGWGIPFSDGGSPVTGYIATATAPNQATGTCQSSKSGCNITGLVGGVAYTVTISAMNAIGTGAPSAPVIATPY